MYALHKGCIQRINRNIVECKSLKNVYRHVLVDRINRNIVECKLHARIVGISIVVVLIETLWNVNCTATTWPSIQRMVLIETLWNVNSKSCGTCFSYLGINRNIVECKYICRSHWRVKRPRINRNIVECKWICY